MNVKENLLLAHSRMDSYKLLSQCYYLPDQNLLEMLKGIQSPIGSLWKELIGKAQELDSLDILKIDYSRLFVGPFKLLAPPYESVYLETGGQIVGDITVKIRNLYLDEGIDVNIKEMPDHVAIELEFMYYLISKEISALNDGDDDRLQNNRNEQLYFLNEHLCCWISQFCRAVSENAQTGFYKSLGKVTKNFVLNDGILLEQEQEHFDINQKI